ncbi:hypothetical protein [Bradyrhizobium amphicarpaeae]|uniref:BA14K family protein n=1 Tax=Bradyrhizobium amphicarpaeae TaxID=1404768 RepID=A0A2U8PY30_9BRAD|nr:hypothetical protein [Bradyrhizobium amphicarpaeae]AWM02612.1 hypothetical protein CIT40_22995 [Bradyrhizobium amphicarpaeae]
MTIRPVISAAGRKMVLAAFASLALVASSASPSAAASPGAVSAQPVTAGQGSSDVTDFSAVRRRHYRRGSNAAGLAFMGAAVGIIGGVIAEQRRRDYYENRYYAPRPYYGGPGYYGGGSPYYYDPGYRYGPY